jgi:hypothetical protein
MATAKRVPAEAYYYQLTLTPFEAEVLRAVCSRIGGTPGESYPRGAMDNIGAALRQAGVHASDFDVDPSAHAIHFVRKCGCIGSTCTANCARTGCSGQPRNC